MARKDKLQAKKKRAADLSIYALACLADILEKSTSSFISSESSSTSSQSSSFPSSCPSCSSWASCSSSSSCSSSISSSPCSPSISSSPCSSSNSTSSCISFTCLIRSSSCSRSSPPDSSKCSVSAEFPALSFASSNLRLFSQKFLENSKIKFCIITFCRQDNDIFQKKCNQEY